MSAPERRGAIEPPVLKKRLLLPLITTKPALDSTSIPISQGPFVQSSVRAVPPRLSLGAFPKHRSLTYSVLFPGKVTWKPFALNGFLSYIVWNVSETILS